MKTKHLLKIFLTTFLLFPALWADSPAQPDAVYREMLHEYTLNPDGSTVYRHSHAQKMLSYFAFTRKYGESFIVYDPQFQELKIDRSLTVMADGKNVESPFNAFNEVLPRFAKEAPAYNRLREMVVTHPGMELGATVHLEYRITSNAGFLPAFMQQLVLSNDCPIEKLTVRVRVPEDREFHYALLNITGEPTISRSEGMTVYEWTFRDLAAVSPENNQPVPASYQPTLRFSTAPDWQIVFTKITAQEAFQLNSSSELSAVVENLKDETVSDMELLCALQEKVANELALFPIPPEVIGYRCRSGAEVWQSNGGTPLEKAVLLAALLWEAGFSSASPMLLSPTSLSENVASLQQFDQVVVGMKWPDGDWLLLPVDKPAEQNLRLTEPIAAAWRLSAESGEMLRLKTSPKAETHIQGKLRLDGEQQISGKLELKLGGAANPYLKHVGSGNSYEKLLGKALKPARVEKMELLRLREGEARIRGEVSGEAGLKSRKTYFFWEIPAAPGGVFDYRLPDMPLLRTTPLELPADIHQSERLAMELPDNLRLAGNGREIQEENSAGRFYLKISAEGNAVRIQREIQLNREISPEIYPEFQRLWSLWADPGNQRIVLKEK
ncbi:MAG: hypothetical protein Kow0042_04180 [Calditrichia bacterium]